MKKWWWRAGMVGDNHALSIVPGVTVRAEQAGANAAWAVSVLMQLTPHARLVGAFIPTLLGWAGALSGFVLELSAAPEELQFPECSPASTWWPTGRTSQRVPRQLPSGAVTIQLLCTPTSTACQGTAVCLGRDGWGWSLSILLSEHSPV